MSIHKEIHQEAAKIRAYLLDKCRVYAYWHENRIVIKDKNYCKMQLIGSYDKWMLDIKNGRGEDKILKKLQADLDALINRGHIPSSLGKYSELMRANMEEV